MIFLDATDCIKGELEDPNVLHLAWLFSEKVSIEVSMKVGNHLGLETLPSYLGDT